MIEAKEEKYDFNIVNSILQFANKYDLKIELLWFSTNMVGDSFTYLTPNTSFRIIINDSVGTTKAAFGIITVTNIL